MIVTCHEPAACDASGALSLNNLEAINSERYKRINNIVCYISRRISLNVELLYCLLRNPILNIFVAGIVLCFVQDISFRYFF